MCISLNVFLFQFHLCKPEALDHLLQIQKQLKCNNFCLQQNLTYSLSVALKCSLCAVCGKVYIGGHKILQSWDVKTA